MTVQNSAQLEIFDFQTMEDIDFAEAVESDNEEIVDFMNKYFVPFEPLNMAINLCEPGCR